jgi:hypothetical protein
MNVRLQARKMLADNTHITESQAEDYLNREVKEFKVQRVVKLYFEGYSVKEALKVVRNEAIQTSRVSARAN